MAAALQAPFVAAVLAAMLSLGGCQSGDRAAEGPTALRIVSTTSFGMCVGYCSTRLEIAPGEAVLTRSGRGGRGGGAALPDEVTRAPLSAQEWQDFARLAKEARFEGLSAVIGCPDCADGGAESLTVETKSGVSSVSFDYGAKIDGIADLLDRVRARREAMSPKAQ